MQAGDQIGPYTLVRGLGSGAFGVVWLAEHRTTITTTRVALKIPLNAEFDLEAIKYEADLWAQASGHPNVLPIIEANIYDGQVVIVSEYAPDGSLTNWLKSPNSKIPIGDTLEMINGILAGLEHLHARQIIHRDLKPDNILLQGAVPRLADFGISRIFKSSMQSSIAAGTPAYMAPETFFGRHSLPADLWSVGVICYRMLAGRMPFPHSSLPQLMQAIIYQNPEPLPDTIPLALQEVVNKALCKNARHRYQTATEMRLALKNVMASLYQPYIYKGVNEIEKELKHIIAMPTQTVLVQAVDQPLRPPVFMSPLIIDSGDIDSCLAPLDHEELVPETLPIIVAFTTNNPIREESILRSSVISTYFARRTSKVEVLAKAIANYPIIKTQLVPRLYQSSQQVGRYLTQTLKFLNQYRSSWLSRGLVASLSLLLIGYLYAQADFTKIYQATWFKPSLSSGSISESPSTEELVRITLSEVDNTIKRVNQLPKDHPLRHSRLTRCQAFKQTLTKYPELISAREARGYAESALSQVKSLHIQMDQEYHQPKKIIRRRYARAKKVPTCATELSMKREN